MDDMQQYFEKEQDQMSTPTINVATFHSLKNVHHYLPQLDPNLQK